MAPVYKTENSAEPVLSHSSQKNFFLTNLSQPLFTSIFSHEIKESHGISVVYRNFNAVSGKGSLF